jgi:ribosomal protein S18 acetylase RimI-like enzyme
VENEKLKIGEMSSMFEMEAYRIHKLCFKRQKDSEKWISANRNAYPMTLCSVGVIDSRVVGFIIWEQKSGFRKQIVLELKQMAVHPDFQGRGIGKKLIEYTFRKHEYYFSLDKRKVKGVMVTTRADNIPAQKSYARTLGVKIVATIPKLFSADEVIMFAKRKEIPLPMRPPWKD